MNYGRKAKMEKEKMKETLTALDEIREDMSSIHAEFQEIDTNLSYCREFLSQEISGWKDVTEYCNLKLKAFNEKLISFEKNVEALSKNLKEVESELSKDNCQFGQIMNIQVKDMPELSQRTKNACKNADICYMVEFITRFKTRKDILRIRNIGMQSINEIAEALAKYGIELK